MQKTNSKEFLLWLLTLRRRYRVVGGSMLPLLRAGDEVLADPRAYRRRLPKVGEIVVAQHPGQADILIIKRISAATADGLYCLAGDNPDLTQTSSSLVPRQLILGRVTSEFS